MEEKKSLELLQSNNKNGVVQDINEDFSTDATSNKSGSILISVNSVRNIVHEEKNVEDERLNNVPQDEINYEEPSDNSNDILSISESLENDSEAVSFESDEMYEDTDDDQLPDDIIAYDVEEFEDNDNTVDACNGGNKLNAKKIGCLSCSAVFLLMVILLITVTTSFYHYYNLMEIENDDSIYYNDTVTFSDSEISEIPDGDVNISEGSVCKDKDVFNILLIGTDERTKGFSKNARADSIMLFSIDNSSKKIRLVSLERGMLVSIPGHKNDILTHTFRYGGSNLLMETVRTHFKVDVNKYMRVNFSMFEKLVDEVGGVDVTLTEEEAYGLNTYPNNNTWKLKRKVFAGENHFNGYEALQYARLRWIDDDFHRIERQRKVIVSIKEGMTDLSVSDLKDISEDCLPYIQTNLSAMEFADLLIRMPGYFENEIDQMTIPQKGTYKTLGNVDFDENARLLNEFLYVSKNN